MAEVNGIKFLCIALLMAGIMTQPGALSAQEVKHLNPAIEKLAAGKPFIGFQTGDLSVQNARTIRSKTADDGSLFYKQPHARVTSRLNRGGDRIA